MNPRSPIAMWDAREAGTLIHAAEKAAEAGNFASAENLLREAARLQEANLGPRDPELANTLNNLGIVCEMTGKTADAEQYFRRAVSIARTSLPADHPFVTTSQKNLREFCEARGKQVDLPSPAPLPSPPPLRSPAPPPAPKTEVVKPAPAVTAVQKAEPAQEIAARPEAKPTAAEDEARQSAIDPELEDPEVTSRKFFTRVAFGALGPIAMLMVVLAVGLPRLGAPELNPPSTAVTDADSPRNVPPPAAPVPAEPIDTPEAAPAETTTTSEDTDEPETETTRDSRPAVTSAPPVVVRASLCGDLDDWSCDPADRPVPPGPLFFYTQIKSATATTVQHRWYHNDHLLQAVPLRVQPNGAAGYRTYSRNVMTGDSAGNWRVELRSKDGALLHEERFTVR